MSKEIKLKCEGKIVMTSTRVAQIFGVETINILQNYDNHSLLFTEGVDYYIRMGDNFSGIKLWTAAGLFNHMLILHKKDAFEKYAETVKSYFNEKGGF